MRIVIDLQGAQTESSKRGIGRYSLALAQAITRHRREHDILLALNGRFPDRIESIRASFEHLLPQEKIRIFDVPGPVQGDNSDNRSRRQKAELIREAFLAHLQPDVVLVTSLFEGYIDEAVTSIGRLAEGSWRTASILYDLIPLAIPKDVFANSAHRLWYNTKLNHLKRADTFLAISEYSRQEAIECLALDPARITNISTAVEESFRRITVSKSERDGYLLPYGIVRPFVLYVGGFDRRKNVERAIRAFALLPAQVRDQFQLVLAGGLSESEKLRLQMVARHGGLDTEACLFTGHIDDGTLIALYNLCTAFIFPSLREGFGLPVLEAMACGAPIIASNVSSIPEVVGLAEALFDPESEADISGLLARTLTDDVFRARLRNHGLAMSRSFSWDRTARCALNAIERGHPKRIPAIPDRRSRLALVSPLPPQRTGIANYSAELMPALSQYYDIVLIVDRQDSDCTAITMEFPVHDSGWLLANANKIDRVLYQVGNSPFHDYMRKLMTEVPGTVVLHDFFLSGLFQWVELNSSSKMWTRALYNNHGYMPVRVRYKDAETAKLRYPVNLGFVQEAQGVIVHSEHARTLARQWLGPDFTANWKVIPHVRKLADPGSRGSARDALGVPHDAMILCSFGFLDAVKLNHRLIEAFLGSSLARDPKCYLIFVGENHVGDYGAHLLQMVRDSAISSRILVTGWADPLRFRQYLAAADMAIQLRTGSRGETSGTVLDCLSSGLPVIVNAHGSAAELPNEAVWMLEDDFSTASLITALETLRKDKGRRDALGHKGRDVIATRHTPEACAGSYAEAIETCYAASGTALPALVDALAVTPPRVDEFECRALSCAVARSLPTKRPLRQLLLDVSATCRTELKTGIERVARAVTLAFLEAPPDGFRVEPVYLSNEGGAWHYRYARSFTLGLLGCPSDGFADAAVELQAGDVLLGLDNSGHGLIEAETAGLFVEYRNRGIAVYFTVHDLLPLRLPQYFPPGSDQAHEKWLRAVLKTDGALCVSRTVADDLRDWVLQVWDPSRQRPFRIGWSHHGADIGNAAPTSGVPDQAARDLTAFAARPTFLMVGTIEPRKGYLHVLDAFDQVWSQGIDINLAIIGAEGWVDVQQDMRRTIPKILSRLRSHPEKGRRLLWVKAPSDEYLEKLYAASYCLIAASEGEGFGLPLIEAARHRLPIIARDIPVFREVAGNHAFYFQGQESDTLAQALKQWMALYEEGKHPKSQAIPWMTWAQSVDRLKNIIFKGSWYASLPSQSHEHEDRKRAGNEA
jgi:glycosyltransferase involved in cell wall biosynthesis